MPGRPCWPNRLVDGSDDMPFVGRSAELEELGRVWDHVEAGRRRAVFVGGEPGAGKSQFVTEVARRCEARGAAVTLGMSFAELGVPFQPFSEVLTHLFVDQGTGLLEQLPPDVPGELVRLVEGLADHRSERGGAGQPAGVEDRRRLFDAVVAALRSVTERWPLVLILEDVHWAGQPTVQLLAHLVRSTAAERLLIVATHRTTAPERSDLLTHTLAELLQVEGVSRLDLPGLGTEAIADLLVQTGIHPANAAGSAPLLHRQTGGNPFLLRQLRQHLRASGGLGALRSPSFTIPRSIGDTLDLRLRDMSPVSVAILEIAAIIGDPGDPGTLLLASGSELDATLVALGAGVDAGLVHFLSPVELTYTFVHDLARQAMIDRVPPTTRPRLHAQVAQALEASPRAVHRRSSRLAHHWIQAGLYDTEGRGVHWLIEAGREAEHSLAFEEAATHLERAAERLPPDEPLRRELLLAAASNAVLSGAFADGRRLYELLADDADPEIAALAAIGYEDSCWRPGLPGAGAVEWLSNAAQRLEPTHPLRIRVLASLGRALGFIGQHDQATLVGELAIATARERGDDALLAVALQASLWAMAGDADVSSGLTRAREVGRLAESLGDWELLAQAGTYRGTLSYKAGRPDEWRQAREQLEVAQRQSGQAFYAHMTGCSDYALAYLSGDFSAARYLSKEILQLGSTFGQDDTEGVYGLQSFMIRRATGELQRVRSLVTGDESLSQSYWAPGLLALYTEFGLHDAGRRVVAHLLKSDLENECRTSQWAATIAILVDAAYEQKDDRVGRQLLGYLEPHSGHNLVAGHFVAVFGSADRYLGMLCHLVGSSEARAYFEKALEMDEAMGAPVHRAETLARYAQFLRTDDPSMADARQDEAHELAVRLGMTTLAKRTEGRADERDGDRRGTADGLTKREIEVMRCLARGLSNKEIAAALFIAENTAANHVRSIMMKTDSANRTQAAMYASTHSIL